MVKGCVLGAKKRVLTLRKVVCLHFYFFRVYVGQVRAQGCCISVHFFSSVSARTHISQVQGGHRAQVHWYHFQIWAWPLPDCAGEEGIYGEPYIHVVPTEYHKVRRGMVCVFDIVKLMVSHRSRAVLTSDLVFACRGHWRRMPTRHWPNLS